MKRIEDMIGDKLCDIANYLLSLKYKPDITIDKVTDLDEKAIDELIARYGIEGVIIDVDETLRSQMQSIPQCNKDWIEILRGRLKVIILSNGVDREVESYFTDRGIDYVGFAMKPLKRNFRKACQKMGVSPDRVLVLGDSLFDDIYGGKRNNMRTGLVKRKDTERGE